MVKNTQKEGFIVRNITIEAKVLVSIVLNALKLT
jgi:hypothetical protein